LCHSFLILLFLLYKLYHKTQINAIISDSLDDENMQSITNKYRAFGFSGSRSDVDVSVCDRVSASVPDESRIIVGCAAGVDLYFRSRFPHAEVFTVDRSLGRGGFAKRSVACVDAVMAAGGLWVSFPSSPCPAGLVPHRSPSRCFSGRGSGTWASLAYAIGRDTPALVYLGAVSVPVGWGLAAAGDGWYSFQPVISQQLMLINA
jgi:hypothetical protein